MALELLIKHGDEAANRKDFTAALQQYTQALSENPNAFLAYIKRATVYSKTKQYDLAKQDIAKALEIAESRGKRNDKALTYYKLGLVNYGESDYVLALRHFQLAKELGSSEAALDIWIAKAERDVKKVSSEQKPAISSPPSAVSPAPSTSLDAINQHAPLKAQIRNDWYQSNEAVTITIYAKKVDELSVKTKFRPRSAEISFPTSGSSEYSFDLEPLYGEIVPEESLVRVFGTKLELTLVKKKPGKWASLEGDGSTDSADPAPTALAALVYPSSAKKAINWSSFDIKDEEEPSGAGNDFFEKLYLGQDDDTRRAMMKSYVESNGTVLTTNWDEAKDKKFETSPPEGMEAKKW